MAEIRKFDPAAGNAIAQSLRAAMGEPVRPFEPGARTEASRPAESTPPHLVTINVKTIIAPAEDDTPSEDDAE